VAITGWHMLIGGLPLLGGVGLAGSPLPPWSPAEWGLMAYATVFGSALAYGLFFWFANSGDLTGFTALTFLTPVFALLCGVWWLDEQLRPLQWLGALLALVSVLLISRRKQLWQGGSMEQQA
jgi:drug/metabolite transporter (DMT)-like permease